MPERLREVLSAEAYGLLACKPWYPYLPVDADQREAFEELVRIGAATRTGACFVVHKMEVVVQ